MQRLINANQIPWDCNYNEGNGCDKICDCGGCVHRVTSENAVQKVQTIAEIPENPTNGDIIKALFPNAEVKLNKEDGRIVVWLGIHSLVTLDSWWDAPYRCS